MGGLGFEMEIGRGEAKAEEVLILGRFILILVYWLLMGDLTRRILRIMYHSLGAGSLKSQQYMLQ